MHMRSMRSFRMDRMRARVSCPMQYVRRGHCLLGRQADTPPCVLLDLMYVGSQCVFQFLLQFSYYLKVLVSVVYLHVQLTVSVLSLLSVSDLELFTCFLWMHFLRGMFIPEGLALSSQEVAYGTYWVSFSPVILSSFRHVTSCGRC